MIAKCEITRPDGQVISGEFSIADAKEANLFNKDGPWKTAKKRMMKMRARSYAARDGASDLLRGLFVAEEAQDFQPIRDVSAGTGMVERLSARPAEVDAPGFNVRHIAEHTGQSMDEVLDGDNIPQEPEQPQEPQKRKRRTKAEMEAARAAEAAGEIGPQGDPAPDAELSDSEVATPASDDGTETGSSSIGDDTGLPEPETVGESSPASEAEPDGSTDGGETEVVDDDVGDPSQPTSDGSLDLDELPSLTPEETAYSTALASAATFDDAKDALAAFRRTDVFRSAARPDQEAWQIMCYDRTQELASDGVVVPSPHLSPWFFSLWLVWAKDNAKDQIPKIFSALQKSPAYQALNEAQQAGLATGVEQAMA
jgi:hypothetical protein